MIRRSHLPWIGVILIAITLSWIALGHPGPEHSTRLLVRPYPFSEFGPMLQCVFNACSWKPTARRFLLINGLGNVVVFAPLGAVLYTALTGEHYMRRQNVLITTVAGMLISIIFEIAQIWIPGRVVATDDVILNTIGATLGAWGISLLMPRPLERKSVLLDQDDGKTS